MGGPSLASPNANKAACPNCGGGEAPSFAELLDQTANGEIVVALIRTTRPIDDAALFAGQNIAWLHPRTLPLICAGCLDQRQRFASCRHARSSANRW